MKWRPTSRFSCKFDINLRTGEVMRIIQESQMRIPLKIWDEGVPMEPQVIIQMKQTCMLSNVTGAALMPDGHFGRGAAVGAVVGMKSAVAPSITGVDIGCGMEAVKLSLSADQVPNGVGQLLFDHISAAVPCGSAKKQDVGRWAKVPGYVHNAWEELEPDFINFIRRHGRSELAPCESQLGTLGGGNHFISVALDEDQSVWVVLHSGSRGVGNKIGTHFIDVAKAYSMAKGYHLPNWDLSYLEEGTEEFEKYYQAMLWAQRYALVNRQLMMRTTLEAMFRAGLPRFKAVETIDCHHNFCQKETHFGEEIYVTRKGATRAQDGEYGIIPGSMGGAIFIVRGKGNLDSFESCSHGAGRSMSRGDAKRSITLAQHKEAMGDVACRQDSAILDESPAAYKDINAVMAAQSDLVDIVHTLREIANVKG